MYQCIKAIRGVRNVTTLMSHFSKKTSPPEHFVSAQDGSHTYLQREIIFQDFKEAWGYYQLIASQCALQQYHPELFNVYNRLKVKCFTLTAGVQAVTPKDIQMARHINAIIGNAGK